MKKNRLSFSGLLSSLVSQAPRPNLELMPERSQKLTTTIRLDESVKSFYEAQASNLGISIQECIAMTLHGVMRASHEPQATELECQVDRFFELFAAHDIPLTDILDVVHPVSDILREDLLNRNAVLNKYEAKLVDHLSSAFEVSVGWLKGLAESSHDSAASLYKNAEGFARYLAYLKNANRNIKVIVVLKNGQVGQDVYKALRSASEYEDSISAVEIKIIIEKEKGNGNLPIRTFEVIDEELRWNYGNCRYDLKAVMRFMDQTRIFFDGIVLPDHVYESLFSGNALAASVLKGHYRSWHPDQLVWNDERNTELGELPLVQHHYLEEKLNECEVAVRQAWRIKDWNKLLAGENINDLLRDPDQHQPK